MRWSRPGIALAAALAATPAYAKSVPSFSPFQQALQADAVVVGRVVAIDSELVEAEPFPGATKERYAVATVHIRERLYGAAGLTHVRVAFPPAQPSQTRAEILCEIGWTRSARPFELDQEGCFFLWKLPGADFFVRVYRGASLNQGDDCYELTLDTVRKALRVVANPTRALRDREPSARAFAAAVLVQKYRGRRYLGAASWREQPVDAEESRLILRGLAELKWGKDEGDPWFGLRSAWWSLAPTETDGWKQPTPGPQNDADAVIGRAAKDWLVRNADRYRVRQLVAEPVRPVQAVTRR